MLYPEGLFNFRADIDNIKVTLWADWVCCVHCHCPVQMRCLVNYMIVPVDENNKASHANQVLWVLAVLLVATTSLVVNYLNVNFISLVQVNAYKAG